MKNPIFRILILIAISLLLTSGTFKKAKKKTTNPPPGMSIIYGRIVGMNGYGSYDIIWLINAETGKDERFCAKCSSSNSDKEREFAFIVPPGIYNIHGFAVGAPGGAQGGVQVLKWGTREGIDQYNNNSKLTRKEKRNLPCDKLEILPNKIIYIGEWECNREYPIITDDKENTDIIISQKYPGLNLEKSVTIIPKIDMNPSGN